MRALAHALLVLALVPTWAHAAGRVILDPGHGGGDSGAVGRLGDIVPEGLPARTMADGVTPAAFEKDITLDVAQRAAGILRARGWTVTLTRTTDNAGGDRPYVGVGADLKARTDLAAQVGGDAFVSIHANAIAARAASGIETYHRADATPPAVMLAGALQAQMVQALGLPDRGVKTAGFYVLRTTTIPAALVEGGFMTTPADLAVLASVAGRQRWAEAIARGLDAWVAGGAPVAAPLAPSHWWVRATVVRARTRATAAAARLKRAGLRSARVEATRVGGTPAWMVVVGDFPSTRAAERAAGVIRRAGLRPRIRVGRVAAPTTPLPTTSSVQPPRPALPATGAAQAPAPR